MTVRLAVSCALLLLACVANGVQSSVIYAVHLTDGVETLAGTITTNPINVLH